MICLKRIGARLSCCFGVLTSGRIGENHAAAFRPFTTSAAPIMYVMPRRKALNEATLASDAIFASDPPRATTAANVASPRIYAISPSKETGRAVTQAAHATGVTIPLVAIASRR
jgi:hypothetical protein